MFQFPRIAFGVWTLLFSAFHFFRGINDGNTSRVHRFQNESTIFWTNSTRWHGLLVSLNGPCDVTLFDQATCHSDKRTIHHQGDLVCSQLDVDWRHSPLLIDTCITRRASIFARQQLSLGQLCSSSPTLLLIRSDVEIPCGESPLHSLFCWEFAQSRCPIHECSNKLGSVVAYNDAGLSSNGKESLEYSDELHGWAVYSKLQVSCSGIQAGEYHSILGCLVTTNFNMVRAKVNAGRVIQRRCTRVQRAFRRFSHDLRFGLGLHFTAKHATKLYSLGKIVDFRIQNLLLVFATVAATPVCPHWCTCRVQMRRDIQCSLGSKAGCLVS